MPLESLPRETYPSDYLPRAMYRRPMYGDGTTLAMHWDGTYRDRVVGRTDRQFWPDLSELRRRPAWIIAKHLA